jgi:predicted methyltransferase
MRLLFVMSYHDMYWRPGRRLVERHPPPTCCSASCSAALKPGAVVVVQDHVANAGGDPAAVVDKVHRIDPALVRRDFEKAGFSFVDSSDVLAHPGGRSHQAVSSTMRSAARPTNSSTGSASPCPKMPARG